VQFTILLPFRLDALCQLQCLGRVFLRQRSLDEAQVGFQVLRV
jgi:hypothetical protein